MTVIVGVDSSEASKAALRLAAQEARWRQASLVAVSAYELPLGPVGGFPGGAMHTKREEQATAEAELRATIAPQRACARPGAGRWRPRPDPGGRWVHARGGPEGTDPGAANSLSRGVGLSDLIATLAPRVVTLPGRVMWLRTASSSLVTKRTSEQERWTDEDRQ